MGELAFPIKVRDDGTAVVTGFGRAVRGVARGAQRSARLMTRAFTRVRGIISSVSNRIFSLRTALFALGGAAVIRSLTSVVRAAAAQEDAVNKLNAALRTAGSFTQDFSQEMQRLASALQAQTRFGDEAILSMQSLLVTYGVTTDKLEDATRATLDFAAATGVDLNTAALTVGKAAVGVTGTLSRYGIVIDTKAIPKTEIFTAVLEKLNEQFGGRAQADVRTTSGLFTQLSNLTGDFSEQLGFTITRSEAFRASVREISLAIDAVNQALQEVGIQGLGDALAAILPSGETVIRVMFFIARATNELGAQLAGVQSQVLLVKLGFAKLAGTAEEVKIITDQMAALSVAFDQTVKSADALAKAQKQAIAALQAQRQQEQIDGALELVGAVSDLNTEFVGFFQGLIFGQPAFAGFAESLGDNEQALSAMTRRLFSVGDALQDLSGVTDQFIPKLEELQQKFLETGSPEVLQQFTQLAQALEGVGMAAQAIPGAALPAFDETITAAKAGADTLVGIAENTRDKIRAIERQRRQATIAETAGLFGALADLAESGGRASFETVKKFRIAEAIISGISAINKVLAEGPPFPANIIAAAAIAAQTAANVQRIRGTEPGGGGGGISAGGGGGGGAVAAPEPVAIQAAQPVQQLTVNIEGFGFVGDQAEFGALLADVLREAQTDGAQQQVIT